MKNYEVEFSYSQKMYGHIDKLPADNIDDVDEAALKYFKEMYVGDDLEEDFSDFMVEGIMEVKDGE